jgi:AsmA protein
VTAKYVKFALYALGGAVVLFALLLTAVALFVNPNDYKPLIVKLVQEKKQRTLNIEGDIQLKLFPRIGLDLGKTQLSEHKSAQEFAALDTVQLYVAWLPLLRKELVVHKVSVVGARATLIRFPDGTTNIDDLIQKEEEEEQIKFDIDGVKVSRSALQLDDRQGKRKFAISELELKSGRIKDNTHTDIALDFKLAGDSPKLATQVSLSSGLLFALDAKHYVLDDLNLKVSGEAMGITQLDLRAQGNVDAKLDPQEIVLKGIKLNLKGKRAADLLDLALDAPKLILTADKAEAAKLVLDAKIEQPKSKLTTQLTLPDLSGNAKQFQVSQLQLSVDGKQGDNQIKGQLTSPLRGSLDAQTFSLTKLSANLDVSNPKMAKGGMKLALTGDARADLAQQQIAANLHTKLDDSTIQAKLGMSRFADPRYSFDVAIDQLDVDRYLPPKAKTDKPEAESPIDLSALKGIHANGSLKIGTLKVANLKSSNVRLDVKADGKDVNVSPLSANLYQGAMRGTLSASASASPHMSLQQQLTGISIGPLLKDLADMDLLDGRGNVALNVKTQGASVSAMKKNLNGSANVDLRDGAIKGINIASSLRKAQAQLGMAGKESAQAASSTEKTDFSELSASFTIRNGVAHNEDLAAKSPLLRLGGNGDIDIGNGSMNYLAKATVVGSLEGQGGKELTQLKGVTVPLRITGPFDALAYKLDTAALVTESAKAKLEERKQELQEKAGKKLLKGLFGK